MRLAMANRWFHRLIMEGSIWKYACLRDLHVPSPCHVSFSWFKLYVSAFDGSHSYAFRQQEKHIDWMRIGAFFFESRSALLSEELCLPKKIPNEWELTETTVKTSGACVVHDVKTGIWIADLQLVRCPVCNLNTCEGTMQTLDARHIELFMEEGYKDGTWEFEDIGTHHIDKHINGATGVIFDLKHIHSPNADAILDTKKWVGQPNDWQPRARVSRHAVAVNTNLQPNEGLHVKYQIMRGGANGPIVAIRISQQLV
ncbi:putative F-box protein [Acorus gramineus]|uniref:F-box protein n=1 Tax=Acorus gramineus TaxID=55184 RepID=A0AAV9BFM8_ACOGR|nr:putative F-box protein [Acorus gramineus]